MRYRDLISEEGRIVPGVNTTPDVKPGETKRQGAKLGFDLSPEGVPPIVSKDSVIKTLPKTEESTLTGTKSPLTDPGTPEWQEAKAKA